MINMCHPTILWYGCDHLTFTQLKCPLDALNMEHTFDGITLACSGDSCCLCALPAIPNIQELKNNWLSASKVAKFFKVEADDKNMEDLITLFFEKGHYVQCEEYAALRFDSATASHSPPASESGTPAPEPVEPTQVPSPRSPVTKQSKRGRPASQNKQFQNILKNKASTSKLFKTTATAQSQSQTQVDQKPPTSQPTPVIHPKPMVPALAQTYAHVPSQRPVPSRPTPAFQPVPAPQSFPRQSFPTPVSPPLFEIEDASLAETFLQWKHELDLAGGDFTKVDFEQIAAYIELEERSGIKNGNQDPSQGLFGTGADAGAAFDTELQQVSQHPIAQPNVQAQGGRVQDPAQARVAFHTTVQQQQPRPIQRQAQNIQTHPAVDATSQQEQRMKSVHYDARQAQGPVNSNLQAHPQKIVTPVYHATQKFPNANAPLPLQRAPVQHTADSSAHSHPVQPTTQRPINANVHAQVPLQGSPIQNPSGHAHPQHRIQKLVNVNSHAQRPQQRGTPVQYDVQNVPQQRALLQAVPQQNIPPQSAPQQNAPIQRAHNTPAQPEQTPYDGTNWGDKGVYLPDENVYFAGDKPHSPNLNPQPYTPIPELDTTFALSESDPLASQERFDEQASFSEFTNIDKLCDESGDAMMVDISTSSEQCTATVQGSQGRNMHQPIDPLLSNQCGNQLAYDRDQTSSSGRSTPSHMNMSMNTQQSAAQEFVQRPPQIVFHQNDPNAVTQLSSEEVRQIAAATRPKRKGRGRPRKAQTASITIVDNGNGANPISEHAGESSIAQGAASTDTASTTSASTTAIATTANDPTHGISKATAATSRITKQSTTTTTTTTPPSPSTTGTKPRTRSNSNAKTIATTTKGRGRGRNTKKKEDNERKGTLVTIERPPADDTADPTEEYIQRYSNPVAMLTPCSS